MKQKSIVFCLPILNYCIVIVRVRYSWGSMTKLGWVMTKVVPRNDNFFVLFFVPLHFSCSVKSSDLKVYVIRSP
jgi:hypothetical protein